MDLDITSRFKYKTFQIYNRVPFLSTCPQLFNSNTFYINFISNKIALFRRNKFYLLLLANQIVIPPLFLIYNFGNITLLTICYIECSL